MHNNMSKKIFLIFIYLFAYSIFGQSNQPPVISSEGNSIYCPQTQQNIVTSFNIEDPDDDTLDALYIQISEGYSPGEDQLIYNGSNPDLNTSWNVTDGKLEISSLSGENLPISDIIDAVYEVVFFSSNPNPSDKSFSFTIGNANFLPSTGHYYVYFEQTGITWIQAQQAAENSNYYGLQGYLATILSEEENQISAEQAGGAGWIGASDQGVEGEWNWVTGPEGLENGGTGTPFWIGQGPETGGGPVNGMYSNWNNDPSEPNQAGDEDYAHITDDSIGLVGSWNDLSNTGSSSGPYQPKGYVVEYGGMPGDPELNLSSSTSFIAPPTITIEPFIGSNCEEVSLDANSNFGDGEVFWFDQENNSDSIHFGTKYIPGITEPGFYTFWVSPFENGECDSYERIEITAFVEEGLPTVINPNVTVDDCASVSELVTDVLINNPCANISNISWSTGSDFGDVNGIGHFVEPSGGFPFAEGIILSSGNVLDGSGPNGSASSGEFNWPGDTDLDELIESSTNNASIIEFDFVPISNKLSFRFIMASEEYDGGFYECEYSDVFAFLLTDQNGVTTNLAVLPETNIPIAITNIHPDNGTCGAANSEYFHGYTPVGEPDIGYDGRTVPLIAQANVNIGETYHIKLAVADATDNILDSAVFIEAGSFDLGINLGEDILIGSGNEQCLGSEVILDTNIDDSLAETEFEWYKDGILLEDEDSSTLVVTADGEYSVDVWLSENCASNDSILVEFYVPEQVGDLPILNSCDNFEIDGNGIFDLDLQNDNIISQLTSNEFTITYYESEEDAINNINNIENQSAYSNIVPFSQQIFARIVPDSNPTCFSVGNFLIETISPPDIIVPTALEECDDDYDGIVSFFDLSEKTDEVLNGQTGIIVSYHETIEDAENNENSITDLYTNTTADNQTIHVRLEDNETGCAATTTLELIVNSIPEITTPPVLEVCDANYDGITTIDLSSLDDTILNGQTGITVTYYETQEDADNATNVLPTEYQNSNPNTQELIVRLEDDVTGCYSTTTQGIIVNVPGVIEVTDYELCDYTNPGDLTEVFDITTKDDEIINGQNVSLSYFTSFSDSQDNINALSTAALTNYSNTNSASETIFIRLEQNETGCLSFGSFNVTVNPLPNVIENTDLVQCDIDDVQDGISIYNLEEAAENLVIGDDPNNYVLTFHLSQADLDAGINAIEDPTAYVNLTPLQNIYCRVENINTTCYTTSYFYLETIFNPIPEDAGLIVCDNSEGNGNDYDGLGLFTLSDADEYVLSLIVANPNNDITDASQLSIAYYVSEEDALLELNQLPNEYVSEVPDAQTVYLRVERDNDCFGINSMLLEVLPVPQYNEVPDEILCTDTPGVIDIDLTEYDAQVLGSQDPNLYIVTYHSSQLDADTGFNALESPYTVNEQETIYARVEVDNSDPFTTGCFISNINFTLTVEPKPVFAAPTPLIVCDDDDIDGITTIDISVKTEGIMAGIAENVVTYHETEEDMNAGINAIENVTAYTNTVNPQTLYVRIEDDMTEVTGCYSDTTLELIVQIPPPVSNPPALEYCDADADGFGVFNLTDSDEAIANGLPNLLISYHETQADAENNLFPITEEYDNIVAYQQTIYVRVEDTTITTDCFSYVELLLVVNDVPQINTDSSSLEVCDDDTDGFGLFDLSLSNEEVLNGLDPSEFTITYYENAENAENAENPIITPFAYTNITAFNQTVWVRVENNTTECYNTSSIELTVNELPVLTQPDPLNLCDYNNPGDEVEEFTLEDSIGQVLQGQTGIGITFYETQEDADNATNPIASPYTNTSNAQTIYLRGENEITGCYSTITLDLRVNPIPSPVVPDPIEECDEDNDGFTFFNVEDNEADIINGELDIVLSYYETTTNAENAVDPIISPYYNIVPDSQIIFVRAENIVTGCFTIVEQELVTIPSPELPLIIEDIVVCDDDYDGITVFDLSQRDEDIFGEQSTTDFGLTYHETLIDAETGENPIINTTSYQNLTNPQTIFVRLEDLNNDCVSIGEFNLIVALPPVIVQPTALEECDDEVADETTEFDLTVKNDEITAGNIDWEVIYYETQEDALAGTNAIENPEAYTNTAIAGNAANPQTLHVAVVNIEGCIAYTTLTIRVLPNPTPSTDAEDIELCDYDNPGDQIEVFDITINEAYIINGELGVSAAYYESLENATDEIDPIVNPTTYSNIELGQQTIYVRVTNDTTGCFTIVTFDVIVNPLPDIGDVPDVIACEINTDGFFDFDLETVTSELLGAQDPANFTVTYHETQEDADNGENALVSPYTNLTNPQQLFVNITNNLTGCNITGAGFNIEVQEAAIANGDGVPAELIICDDPNTANDGFAQFNLTDLDAQILDGQDPVNFTVTYYATIEDAEASTNPLPTSFENTSNPQTIFVRVDNDTNVDDQCYDITDATLLVNLLPEFTLEDSYMACVDVNGTELIGPTVMLIDLPVNEYTFEWINPIGDLEATTAAHTPLMGGIYTAVATDILTGCRKEVTTEVIPSSPAIVEAVVTTLAFAEEHVIEANAVGSGDYEYRLDDGPWQLDGTFTDVSPGEHIVTVRDLNGCGIGTKSVLVIDYPRFFTPNGDGYNDTWQIIGIDTRPLSTIYIFDRYGKLLKQLSPLSEGWDGTFNGKPLPATDYWFSVKYEEPGTEIIKTFRAHFSLKR